MTSRLMPLIPRCNRRGTSSTQRSCTGPFKQVQSIWGAKSIFITGNGCGASDAVAEDARVDDSDRVFLRACLGQLQRATSEGVPIDGYFLWSAQDNFEWMDGFGNRFGLIYVDSDTLERIPKLGAEWFREASRQNAVICDSASPPRSTASQRAATC